MGRTSDTGQFRARTDAGLLGDKIRYADPAAAPVHTDAEATALSTPGDDDEVSLLSGKRPVAFGALPQPDGEEQHGWLLAASTATLVLAGVAAGVASIAGL